MLLTCAHRVIRNDELAGDAVARMSLREQHEHLFLMQGCDFFEPGLDARTVADGFLCRSTSDYATYVECSTSPDAIFERIVEEDDRVRRLRFACCRLDALERVPLDAHDPDAEAFFASLESMGLVKRKDGDVSLTSAGMLLWPLIPQPMQG